MANRWKFGSLEFRMNPSSVSNSVSQVGDNVRTIGGTVISQPTGYIETYNILVRAYQPNARILKEISMPNAHLIKYDSTSSKIYVLNSVDSKIEEYDRNFNKLRDIPISTQSYMGYVGFDVYGGYFYVMSKVSETEEIVYKLSTDGVIINGLSNTTATADVNGYTFIGDYLWRHNGHKIQKFDYFSDSFAEIVHVHPPVLANVTTPNEYSGLASFEDKYLITGMNRGSDRAVLYLDSTTASIAGMFYIDGMNLIHDIEQIDDKIMVLNRDRSSLQIISANTTLLDIYKLENEINSKGYLYLEDDIGYQIRASVMDYGKERMEGFEHMYMISMRIQIVDGGAL